MPDPSASSSTVTAATLNLSKAPLAELAAGALRAQKAAGIEPGKADYIVVAVPGGRAGTVLADGLEFIAQAHVEP